jgi:hypothetical protein
LEAWPRVTPRRPASGVSRATGGWPTPYCAVWVCRWRTRSDYDEFMLAFHDYLKGNAEFQSNCPKYRLEFQPGAAWMAFTDVVPHAVESGQFAMEQTLIVPRDALAVPERAPIAILEKLAGRSLALAGCARHQVGQQASMFEWADTARERRGDPRYGATAMVTWSEVVTPLIVICNGTALPVGVPVGSGTTPI